ncbi:hypothetical protein O181_108613 [Austropuccinia psidii MF-1]|uniref:Uncharacterized protein n=1 Tax=Austropuccinia psidii MF-1 TaxID=1389203 RepID=A0A9Q3JT50_9BASI|nr:hypothetical protein [Austropuccinia psidii MF-1]
MESQQAVQIPQGKGIQNKGESSHYPRHRRTNEPKREYSYSLRLTRSKPTIIPSGFTPLRHKQISGQESPLFTIPGSFQETTIIKREKQEFLKQDTERVRPHDLEAVGLCERSTQAPDIVLNTSDRISSPTTKNIIPTQNENSVFTPEININRNELWCKMS